MAEISPIAFYGTHRKARPVVDNSPKEISFHQKLRVVEEEARVYKERPLVNLKRKSFFTPHRVWETFATQIEAIDFCLKCREKINDRVRIFSQEVSSDGKRIFLVTTDYDFWEKYKGMHKKQRNFYELIEEGQLCRLYFDLEFNKEANKALVGTEVLELFIETVCFYLQEIFSICCSRGNIVDLDSTTDTKFSRHLIFHLPGAIFSNNVICGNFVRYIYEMTRRKAMENDQDRFIELKSMNVEEKQILPPSGFNVEKLFVQNKDGKKAYFCDLGVYSRNRNFRLYGSTKLGRNSNLVVSKQNGFHGSFKQKLKFYDNPCNQEYQFFLDTLICFHGNLGADTKALVFGDATAISHRSCIDDRAGMQGRIEDGHRDSPFPKLDAFILKQVNKGGVQGVIRRWIHFVNTSCVIYDIDKNKWCDNVRRPHKSNHIYLVVEMKHGVFYQKCHDPDCSDFKSEEKLLPADVNPFLNDSDYFIDDFEDSSQYLYEAAEIAECEESLTVYTPKRDSESANVDFNLQFSGLDLPPMIAPETSESTKSKNLFCVSNAMEDLGKDLIQAESERNCSEYFGIDDDLLLSDWDMHCTNSFSHPNADNGDKSLKDEDKNNPYIRSLSKDIVQGKETYLNKRGVEHETFNACLESEVSKRHVFSGSIERNFDVTKRRNEIKPLLQENQSLLDTDLSKSINLTNDFKTLMNSDECVDLQQSRILKDQLIKSIESEKQSTPINLKKMHVDDSLLKYELSDIFLDDGFDEELMTFI